MVAEDITADLKIKMYCTKSSFDVQGLKPHFATVISTLGDRTIAVYFVEVILEAIFQSMMNGCNLDEYNLYCKSQAKLGLNQASKLSKNGGGKSKKEKKKAENAIENKCKLCDTKPKGLNSFKCNGCIMIFINSVSANVHLLKSFHC